MIIPGDGRLTVFSQDPRLLDQVEGLLRALAPSEFGYGSSSSNFAVFGLRNAGARQIEQLLKKVLEKMPETARGTLRDVRLAADERLNALIVHGRTGDRAVIADLLRVLDSSNVPESLATRRPQIVPVHNTEADRVAEIVRSVYKAQINERGQQREIDIPEGLSDEVATVLRQLNAASAGPLLTVEVDVQTNSIVLLAPQELGQEVTALIRRLDENAKTQNSRSVQLIQLRSLKSEAVQSFLDDLLRSRSR